MIRISLLRGSPSNYGSVTNILVPLWLLAPLSSLATTFQKYVVSGVRFVT